MKNELRFGISPREIPITVTQGSVAVKVKLCVVHIHWLCVLCVSFGVVEDRSTKCVGQCNSIRTFSMYTTMCTSMLTCTYIRT